MDNAEEPFQVPKDLTNGFHLTREDLKEKRNEIHAQINYLLNMLKQIDMIYENGEEVLTEDEVKSYLKLDILNGSIPKDIPRIKLGVFIVYYRKDITKFLESKRRGGRS